MRAFLGTCMVRAISHYVPDVLSRFHPHHTPTGCAKKTAALTFDDGPTAAGTPALLEVLADFGIPATFFLLGQQAEEHPGRVREIVDAGHVVGNHSYSHLDCWKSSPEEIVAEFERATGILEDLGGQRLGWMRPPYGKVTKTAVRWARKQRQQMMLWNVMPPDFQAGIPVSKLRTILQGKLRDGGIVCLHDNANSQRVTPQLLRETLPELLADGWTFTTLTADYELEDSGTVALSANGLRGGAQISDTSTSKPKAV